MLLNQELTQEQNKMKGSIVERAAKRMSTDGPTEQSAYLNTRFLLPTSNICQHFFSIVGYALTNSKKGILWQIVEAQLFLFMNRELWSISDVKKVIHHRRRTTIDDRTTGVDEQ